MAAPEFVGFWRRLLAALIDLLALFVVAVPLLLALGVRAAPQRGAGMLLAALAVLAFWRLYGATPGKMAIGARIVDAATGGQPAIGRLIVRLLGYFVSALPFFLGFLWIGVSRRKQGFHDKLARTKVIYDD